LPEGSTKKKKKGATCNVKTRTQGEGLSRNSKILQNVRTQIDRGGAEGRVLTHESKLELSLKGVSAGEEKLLRC